MKPTIITLSTGEIVDLTKLEKPLGMYPEEVREALKEHGGPYECFYGNDWARAYVLGMGYAYRLAPVPLTKPDPPWHMLADWVQWVARDSYGVCSGFELKPDATNVWWIALGQCRLLDVLKFDPGTCDWKDSLVMRPGVEP
jgi:hypothetical protein